MMTIRQIERLWNAKSFAKLSQTLLAGRQEASFGLGGFERPCAVAALAIIRMDELNQSHLPLYGDLVRAMVGAQDADGGWGDPAVTSLCLRALLLCDGKGDAIDAGLRYLGSLQKPDGIWPDGPMRRMFEDPLASLFVFYQLADNSRFREAVRFSAALEWFSSNAPRINPEYQPLLSRITLRCRSFASQPEVWAPALFAA